MRKRYTKRRVSHVRLNNNGYLVIGLLIGLITAIDIALFIASLNAALPQPEVPRFTVNELHLLQPSSVSPAVDHAVTTTYAASQDLVAGLVWIFGIGFAALISLIGMIQFKIARNR
jgi:hypothetical protein